MQTNDKTFIYDLRGAFKWINMTEYFQYIDYNKKA